MASAKILTHMLRQDNIPYKTRPVASLRHIRETAEEIAEMDIRTVFLLNCGAVSALIRRISAPCLYILYFLWDRPRIW